MPDAAARRPDDALTRDCIVAAAIELAEREGPAALTMRRLAKQLGVEAMSIYHHIPNKAALVDDMLAAAMAPLAVASEPAPGSVDRLSGALRRLLATRPAVAALAGDTLPARLLDHPASEVATNDLTAAGFDREAARWIVQSVIAFAHGSHACGLDDAAFDTGLRYLVNGIRADLDL